MAIDLNGINVTKLNPQTERAEKAAQKTTERAKTSQQDEVELSENANVLARLEEQIRHSDSFDEQRVAEISQAISEGQYPVDSQRIAQKFIELESQLY